MIPTSPDDRDFPWWLLAVVGLGVWMFAQVLTDETYASVLGILRKGIWTTVYVTVIAYT